MPEHVQPLPAIETSVRPAGTVSVTVTAPLAGPAAAPLLTVARYTALVCPRAKRPACVSAMLRAGAGKISVGSVALAAAEPPPFTPTTFICGDTASPATFTLTAMGG